MRPFPGDGGQRAGALDSDSSPYGLTNTAHQMTFFLAEESAIDSMPHAPPPGSSSLPRQKPDARKPAHISSSYTPPVSEASASYRHHHHLLHHHNHPLDWSPDSEQQPTVSRDKNPPSPLSALGPSEEDAVLACSHPPVSPRSPSRRAPSHYSHACPSPDTFPSQPLTPMMLPGSSAVSIMSSRRNSLSGTSLSVSDAADLDRDHYRDHDAEDEEGPPATGNSHVMSMSGMMDSSEVNSIPQLVMPSIKMPSRRPFTDQGKSLGRFKVLVAGDSGVGKTSLIKAIVQSCEHIVHVDPITPSPLASLTASTLAASRRSSAAAAQAKTKRPTDTSSSSTRPSNTASSGSGSGATTNISEIYASTKPYPEWWSETDDFRLLKRRKSLGDAVLDRNMCFIDTPGYGSGSSAMDTITPVVQYLETRLQGMSSNTLTDGDMFNMLVGEGSVLVDVVFYMISNRIRPVDIQYLQRLAPMANIIPVIAQADLMSTEQIAASKAQIDSQLRQANIRPFSFAATGGGVSPSADPVPGRESLYAISSAPGSDHDTMDASLLMSPDYVRPLVPSELALLVEQVFSQSGTSRLRHAAARKYLQWRKSEITTLSSTASLTSARPMSLHRPLSPGGSASGFGSPRAPPPAGLGGGGVSLQSPAVLTPAMGATSSFALARITDHTQREERLAQVRLANWAADLQRSMAAERAQYEALAQHERTLWLAERLSECVQDGKLVPVLAGRQNQQQQQQGSGASSPGWASSLFRSSSRRHQHRGSAPTSGAASPRAAIRQQQPQEKTADDDDSVLPRFLRRHHHHHHYQPDANSSSHGQKNNDVDSPANMRRFQRRRHQQQQQMGQFEDPLGLLKIADDLRRTGFFALKVVTGVGVAGVLVLWVTRTYSWLQAYEWAAGSWERIWHGRAASPTTRW